MDFIWVVGTESGLWYKTYGIATVPCQHCLCTRFSNTSKAMDALIYSYCSDPKTQHCSSCVDGVIFQNTLAIHTEEISCLHHTCSVTLVQKKMFAGFCFAFITFHNVAYQKKFAKGYNVYISTKRSPMKLGYIQGREDMTTCCSTN